MGKLVLTGNSRTRTRLADLRATGGASTVLPDLTNLILWLDASDGATITDAGSGRVSQWNDKSGVGNNVTQATNGSRPTTGTFTLNSMNVLDFATNFMTTGSFVLTASTKAVTFFAVLKFDSVATDAMGIFVGINAVNSGTDINTFVLETRTASSRIQLTRGNGQAAFSGAAFQEKRVAFSDTGSYHKLIVRCDTTNGTRVRLDGSAQTVTTGSGSLIDADFLNVNSTAWTGTLGTRPGQSSFDGKIAECGFYKSSLSDADCAIAESYLSRWGI